MIRPARRAAAAALALAFLCAAAPASVRLTPANPEAAVALGSRADREPAIGIEVTRIMNRARTAFTLVVSAPGGGVLARLAPFPADEPARFAVRVPPPLTRLHVRLEAVGGRPLPEMVELRAIPLHVRRQRMFPAPRARGRCEGFRGLDA